MDLQVFEREGRLLVDSREVASMIEKRHDHLLRDIKGYVGVIEGSDDPKIGAVDFFLESTYQDGKGEIRPCYLLTKQGCEMVANKLTGKKGILFTAKYVQAFNKMLEIQAPLQNLSPQLQILINMELKQQQLEFDIQQNEREIKGIREIVALNPIQWRKDTSDIINKIARNLGGYEHIRPIRDESYKLLDQRFGVDLKTRLTNKRRRMADEGVCKSKRDKLNQLDVIADDKKLVEGYIAIVKELAIKYGVSLI